MISFTDLILTHKGLLGLEKVKEQDRVFTHAGWKLVDKIRSLGEKNSCLLRTNLGYQIRTFDDQRLAVKSAKGFKFTSLKNLQVGDTLLLLPGENTVLDLVTSEKVAKPSMYDRRNINELNGPFSVELACLVGYMYGRSGIDWSVPIWQADFFNNCAALTFDFNDGLKKEQFKEGDLHFHDGAEKKFSYDVKDPLFFEWFKKNNLDLLDLSHLPNFLFQSPSKVIAAYLIGFLFSRFKNFKSYSFGFDSVARALQMQLLLLREGIITNRQADLVTFETEKSRNEFDRLLNKTSIYKHPCEVWDKEPAQMFYEMTITDLDKEPEKQNVFEVTLEVPEGIQVNGFYVGVV